MNITNSSKTYHNAEHLIYSCQYHVIWCTKYRRKLLSDDIEIRLKEILLDVAAHNNFQILEMEVMPDHVHLIIDADPRIGITTCVGRMKATSSNLLRKEFSALRTRVPTIWTRSCFISTVGTVSLETVKKIYPEPKEILI